MQVPALELSGLTKRFGGTLAVDGLDLSVRQGQGDQVLVLIEGVVPLAWAAAAWLLGSGNNFYLIALAAGVLLPFVARQRGATLGAGYAEAGLE